MNNISIRFAGFYEETSADESASWEIHYLISGEKNPAFKAEGKSICLLLVKRR